MLDDFHPEPDSSSERFNYDCLDDELADLVLKILSLADHVERVRAPSTTTTKAKGSASVHVAVDD